MNKTWATKNGFTIIELLVAIVVIGILVTITVVSYNGIQQRSRDSERASEVAQIKIAIEKYHADNSAYPPACSGVNVGCSVTDLSPYISSYLSAIPHDPKNPLNSSTDYNYIRASVAEDSYAILVTYEAKPACKTGANVNQNWWGLTVPTC